MTSHAQTSYSQTSYSQMPYKTVSEETPKTTQYIIFDLLNYRFAIPSHKILKVVATPPASKGGLVSLGLVQLGPYSIQIIDIATLLALNGTANKDNPRPSVSSSRALEKKGADSKLGDRNPPFLVVFQNDIERVGQGINQNTHQNANQADLWGIALFEPPDLIEVPDYALRPVPAQKRMNQSLRWVSHIVSYDFNSERHSLLVLDLSRILNNKAEEDFR